MRVGPGSQAHAVAETVSRSAKYSCIHRDTVLDIARHAESVAVSRRDLEERTRAALHLAVSHHLLTGRLRSLESALAAVPDNEDDLRAWCRAALASHFSSRERLEDLDDFYPAILDLTGPADQIVDLAASLNPLTLPWLRAVSEATYVGYDFNVNYIRLARAFFERASPSSTMVHGDVIVSYPPTAGAVALLLKTYHCIERRRRGAAHGLIANLDAQSIVVSFPLRSMNGRRFDFAETYAPDLVRCAESSGRVVRRRSLRTEVLVALVKT